MKYLEKTVEVVLLAATIVVVITGTTWLVGVVFLG
jgi:hypothetical protein